MKIKAKNSLKTVVFGVIIGVLNGLFGAGGGIEAVEVLKSFGLNQKKAQTTSIAVILQLCVLSAVIYSFKTSVDYSAALILIPAGLAGALLGTFLMKKMSCSMIKKIFCFFLIYAGVRMILKG